MTLLILGLILWVAAHLFKRVLPEMRARMGDKGKGLVAVVLIASLVLIIVGFRGAGEIYVWSPPAWTAHVTHIFMAAAVLLFVLAHSKSRLKRFVRHPMLTGIRAWAFGHLMVNGDLASIVMFGTLFVWAQVTAMVLNRAEPNWQPPETGTMAGDVRLVVISAVVYAAIVGIHFWLGYPVF